MTTLNQTMMMILTTLWAGATKAAHSWLAYSRRPVTRRRCRRLMRKAITLGLASFMTVSLSVEEEKVAAKYLLDQPLKNVVINITYEGDHEISDDIHVIEPEIEIYPSDYDDRVMLKLPFYIEPYDNYEHESGQEIPDYVYQNSIYIGATRNDGTIYQYKSFDSIKESELPGRSETVTYYLDLSNIIDNTVFIGNRKTLYTKSTNTTETVGRGLIRISFSQEDSTTPTASIQTPTIQDQTATISYTASDTTDGTIGVYDSTTGSLVGTTQSIIADGANQSVTFADLPAGVYTASIKDGDGTVLTTSETFTISAPLNPTAIIQTPVVSDQTVTIQYTTSDTTDATIGVYDSLGSLVGATQLVSDGANQSVTFTDLPAGVYTASIKDGDGTVLTTSETFTIANPDATATITLNSDYFGEEENIAVTYQADNIKNGSISLFDKLDNEVTSSQIITTDNTTQTVTFQPLSPATYTAKINAVDLNDQTVIFASRPFTVTPQATSTIKLLNQPIYQGQHIIVEYTAENLSSGKMGLYTGIHLIGSDQDVVADGTPHTVTLQSLVAGEYEVRLTGQDLRGEEVTFSSPVTVTVPPPTETPTPTATPTETPTPTATPTETATATPTPVLVLQPPPPAEGYTLLMSGVLTVTGQMEARQSCQWSVDGTPLSVTGCTVVLSGSDYAAGDHTLSLNMAGQSQSTTFTVVDDRQRVFLPLVAK